MLDIKALTKSEKKKIARGARNIVGWIVIGAVFALFSGIISGCQKEEKQPVVYKVESSEFVWETTPENARQKVPVVKDVVYLIVGEE